MIGSFLNINGTHYQDTLFLDKFLEILNIKDYDSQNSKIYLEYQNIDLYLTDGIKHIIIENKIWAGDKTAQIERYIDIIKSENENIELDNLLVIYLSLNRDVPSSESLGKLKIKNSYIVDVNDAEITHYKSVHYKSDILKWLVQCQYEVQNITNLNEAIKQYIDVVKMVNNNYEGNVMNLKDRLINNDDEFELAKDIHPCRSISTFVI